MIFRYDTTILLINIHCFIGDPIGIIIHVICYSLFLTSSGVVLTKLRSFACVSASLTCSADLIFIPRDAQRQIAHVSINAMSWPGYDCPCMLVLRLMWDLTRRWRTPTAISTPC